MPLALLPVHKGAVPFRSILGVMWSHKYLESSLVPVGLRYEPPLLWFLDNLALLELGKCFFYKCYTLSQHSLQSRDPSLSTVCKTFSVWLYVQGSQVPLPPEPAAVPKLKPEGMRCKWKQEAEGILRDGHKSLSQIFLGNKRFDFLGSVAPLSLDTVTQLRLFSCLPCS